MIFIFWVILFLCYNFSNAKFHYLKKSTEVNGTTHNTKVYQYDQCICRNYSQDKVTEHRTATLSGKDIAHKKSNNKILNL